MVFGSKQREVEARIEKYCGTILDCIGKFRLAVEQHGRDANIEQAKENYRAVHQAETLADDIRRDIEVMMYSKALFPESRGDILGLLEAMDKVPNQAEEAVRSIYEERLVIPPSLVPEITPLLDICERCAKAMIDCVGQLFKDYTSATVAVGRIDELESEADHIESELKVRIFASNLEGLDKILLRDLVRRFANLCDRAEDVADRVRIIVAKRTA